MKPRLTSDLISKQHDQIFKQFKDPFKPKNYPGKMILYEGRRIKIVSKTIKPQKELEKAIIKKVVNRIVLIVFDVDEETVFLIEQRPNIEPLSIQAFKNQSDKVQKYLQSWKGFCLVKNKAIYHGQFRNFNREGKFDELSFQQVDQQLSEHNFFFRNNRKYLLRSFNGIYTHNVKDSNEDSHSVYNIVNNDNENDKNIWMKVTGIYKCGNAQGQHKYFISKGENNEQKGVSHFLNGCLIHQPADVKYLKKKMSQSWTCYNPHFSVSISERTLASLRPKQWLNSEVLDYYFRRLVFFHECLPSFNKKINIKAMPIEFFQKIMPSYHMSNPQKKINFDAVKFYFEPFKDIISFFEVYQLVLFPLNRDRAHFSLVAISTQTVRNQTNNQLESVKIRIYDLDSIDDDRVASKRIIELLKQSLKYTPEKDRNKFQTAITMAEVKIPQNLKAKKQTNGYDCGLYTCAYGFILYSSVQKIDEKGGLTPNWQFTDLSINQLRQNLSDCLLNRNRDFIIKIRPLFMKKAFPPVSLKKSNRTPQQRKVNIKILRILQK